MPDPANPGNTAQAPGLPSGTLLPPHEMVKFSHFLHRAAHNPETRGVVAALAAKLDPQGLGKQFGDVAIQQQFQNFRKEMADKDLQKQIQDARNAQSREKQQLINTGRYTPQQVADIEKTMIAKGLHSYKDGAILWQAEQPPAPPPVPESQSATWEFPTVVDRNGRAIPFDDFKKDTKKASWNAAYRVIDEFKMNTLPPRFRAA